MISDDSNDEYIHTLPSEASKLAVCPSIFNPWTDRNGMTIKSYSDLHDQPNVGCRYDPTTSYFHLSCSSRREAILREGIKPDSRKLTDYVGDDTGHVFFMPNFFSNADFIRESHNTQRKWKEHYEQIACMIRHNCTTKEGVDDDCDQEEGLSNAPYTMDLWLVFDVDLTITPYSRVVDMGSLGSRNVLEGEYASATAIPPDQCFWVPPQLWPTLFEPPESKCRTYRDDVDEDSMSQADTPPALSPTDGRPDNTCQLSQDQLQQLGDLELDSLFTGINYDSTTSPTGSLNLNKVISELNAEDSTAVDSTAVDSTAVDSTARKRYKRTGRGQNKNTTIRRKLRKDTRRKRRKGTRRKFKKNTRRKLKNKRRYRIQRNRR